MSSKVATGSEDELKVPGRKRKLELDSIEKGKNDNLNFQCN